MEVSRPKQILIVDDEKVVRDLCVRVLSPLGYETETAEDGYQALSCLEKQTFDLILTDLKMPGDMDGLALGQEIKRQYPSMPIIIMTAFPGVESAVGTLRMGAFDYLIKPFAPAELIHCIKTCFAKLSVV